LAIIYCAFISLGLPDGMLGAAWPTMQPEFGVPLGYAGFISLIISAGTIFSSLLSVKVIRRHGTGKVTLFSVLLTAIGLIGFSLTKSLWTIFLCAIPLGIGAGAVDSGLNEYIAEHYKATHMNFLHGFWGIGALTGPLVMSGFVNEAGDWRYGYLTVSIIQFILVFTLFLSLPLWKKAERARKEAASLSDDSPPSGKNNTQEAQKKNFFASIRVKGLKRVLVCFMMYTGIEATLGLWGASYLARVQNFEPSHAAAWVSIYYGGITAGRLLCGFLAMKFTNRQLIRTGEILVSTGVVSMLLGQFLAASDILTLAGFVLIGLGCAPIFPGMLHETPARFGRENAQAVMGFQMAVAYTSTTLLPPLFGWIATFISPVLLPWFLALYIAVLFFLSERVNTVFQPKQRIDC
jgi:fucose permease